MSDNWISLIPKDPHHVPTATQQRHARDRFHELAPDADEIEVEISDGVRFYDCGANFERIACTSCTSDIPIGWWQKQMDDDFDGDGFKLLEYATPCCDAKQTLDELTYEWPQGFARFAIVALNPSIGELEGCSVREFEEILGTPMRVIYQHI